jgi:hypothetical protein
MKQLLMLLINLFGIACFFVGLTKLAFIETAYTWKLWLWWFVYMGIPLIVIGIDLKYFDKVFGKYLYLKK